MLAVQQTKLHLVACQKPSSILQNKDALVWLLFPLHVQEKTSLI